MIHLAAAFLISLAGLPPTSTSLPGGGDGGIPDQEDELQAIQELADGGDAEEALERIVELLEWYPDDVDVLERASHVAEAADDLDQALWYAQLALEGLDSDEESQPRVEALTVRVTELDEVRAAVSEHLDDYDRFAKDLFSLGRKSADKKLYVNAVDLLVRCRGTRFEKQAGVELDALYADPKATSSLIQSGLPVPDRPKSKAELERIARLDAKHTDWDDALEVKSKNYLVRTNMGYEMAHAMSTAMEQMNLFYRKVFAVRGSTPRCTIRVFKSRKEFDEIGQPRSASVQGYYSPTENQVTAYDPRTQGWPISALWETLFHEASHQFTHLVCKGLVPGWLNEGTASYFEGAALLPNKSVITNDIPTLRLWGANEAARSGKPSLVEVISYHSPGSYDGSYYPVGWSLVYFMHNYEDAKHNRPYVKPYQKFLGAYKKKPKEEAFDLFVKTIVEGGKQKDCKTFEEFEARWRQWVMDLWRLRFRAPAAEWVERASGQLKARKKDEALESFRFGLLRNPNDFLTLYESAKLHASLRNKDAAIYNYRKILRQTCAMDPAQELPAFGQERTVGSLTEDSLELLGKQNSALAEVTRASMYDLPAAALKAADAYRDGSLPRQSLRLIDDAVAMLGEHPELLARRRQIATIDGVDVRRWRRLRTDDELYYWKVTGDWFPTTEGAEAITRGTAFMMYRETMPEHFTLEARARKEGRNGAPLFGLVYTADDFAGMRIFGVMDYQKIGVYELTRDGIGVVEDLGRLGDVETGEMMLAVQVDGSSAEFRINGKRVGRGRVFPGGNVGLFVDRVDQEEEAEVEFLDMRVRY